MAYQNQQVPFWDFIRSFDPHGAGVDHPSGAFPPRGTPPPPGEGFDPFSYGGPGGWGHSWGGGWGRGGGRRGRHHHREANHEHREHENEERHGSRSRSPHEHNREHDHEHAEGEGERSRSRSRSPHGPGRHGRRGPGRCGRRGGPHAHGFPRGGFGGWGGRGGGGRHHGPPPPPPPFGGAGAFDFSALIESLSAHPLAQAFRTYAETAAQQAQQNNRSADTLVPEPNDENSFVPPIDIFSTPTAYILHVALPGAKKEDVGVNWDAEQSALNVAGVVYRQGNEAFLRSLTTGERKVGVFERTIQLPPGQEKEEVDGEGITAKLEDGVLVVTVPKVEKEWTDVKKVDIN